MNSSRDTSAYRDAGVDIDAQERALSEVKELARGTFTPGVLSEIGSFGGLFRADFSGLEEPVLVASADGVGTKLAVARMADDFSTIGRDLVNHCVNDILVQGAEPLFFLDYVGAGVLEPKAMVSLVRGVAAGCRENHCALLGGETAEMPGFYRAGDYELVGFIVGVVDRRRLLDGSQVVPGDLVLGLASDGLHTNGYSLARRILFERLSLTLDSHLPASSDSRFLRDLLLAPHRSYLEELKPLLASRGLHGLAHITGGGLTDNLPRVLPRGCRVRIDLGSWPVPELFRVLAEEGRVSTAEMLRVFNMGVGMAAIVARDAGEEILSALRERVDAWVIGEVVAGEGAVEYRERSS